MERAENQHPLKGLYLIRYGRDVPGAKHLISLLDPPEGMRKEEATELNPAYVHHVMEKLKKYSPLDRDLSKIDEKYASDYIIMRRQTEEPLTNAAASKGIVPENSHPLYFILHHEKNPDPPLMPGKVMVAIPAENIPAHLVSFTADDSFYSFPQLNPLLPDQDHGKVFNNQEMAQLLKKRGWLPSTKDKPRFYEAQLWSRRIEDFKPVINNNSNIALRRITSSDWQAYRDFYKGLKDPHMFNQYLAGRDLDSPTTYANLFAHTIHKDSFVMFGLWDGKKMIGQSSVRFIEKNGKTMALLAGSEIADAYRGQRLVDKFYQARMQYLKDKGFEGEIRTTMRPDNLSSLKVAKRNGFQDTGKLDEYGYRILIPAQSQFSPGQKTEDEKDKDQTAQRPRTRTRSGGRTIHLRKS